MNETLKRALSGLVYVLIMWFGTSYKLSFHLLFMALGFVSIYEMWKLRKGKSKFFGFLYILLPFILIHFLEMKDIESTNLTYDSSLIHLIFILTWAFDTFAYLFGVRFGKTKIMPSISPKKSWEGFTGGFIFTVIASLITTRYFLEIDKNIALAMSLFIPFTASLGDFTESYFKRKANVKDSGKFIPGHGGMLDRMDAFMITIPVLYIYLHILLT